MFIEMKVTGLTIDPFSNMPFIILKDLNDQNTIPIWIGLIEASAIASKIENIQLARPMTHDIMMTLIDSIDATVESISITDLKDAVYYAKIVIRRKRQKIELDARPSDAIALALRANAPILVDESVVEKSKAVDLTKKTKGGKDKGQDLWKDILENLSAEDFGKYKM